MIDWAVATQANGVAEALWLSMNAWILRTRSATLWNELFERAGGGRRAGVPGGQDDLERANTDYRLTTVAATPTQASPHARLVTPMSTCPHSRSC